MNPSLLLDFEFYCGVFFTCLFLWTVFGMLYISDEISAAEWRSPPEEDEIRIPTYKFFLAGPLVWFLLLVEEVITVVTGRER